MDAWGKMADGDFLLPEAQGLMGRQIQKLVEARVKVTTTEDLSALSSSFMSDFTHERAFDEAAQRQEGICGGENCRSRRQAYCSDAPELGPVDREENTFFYLRTCAEITTCELN
ncbi:hypothetical protein BaRGS_00023675 [Batillaria attramentaria]|uniref:Uncharacterized protein n=1 Tax=Batillaria attramentaria TaxID=370345 RepID=A0ABD0KD05_9CAEN